MNPPDTLEIDYGDTKHEYVRADAVRELLKGLPESELLGEGGLCAATMRAFTTTQIWVAYRYQPHDQNLANSPDILTIGMIGMDENKVWEFAKKSSPEFQVQGVTAYETYPVI